MAKTTLSYEELLCTIRELPYKDFLTIVQDYAKNSGKSFEQELRIITNTDLQMRLEKLKINSICPKCRSELIKKSGKRDTGVQVYRCLNCGIRFTRFTGTILEKTRWHWDAWIKVLNMTLNNYSYPDMRNDWNKITAVLALTKRPYGCGA